MKGIDKIKKNTDEYVNWAKKNSRILWGVLALVIGFILIIQAREIIGNLILLIIGLFVIYYALYLLKLNKITDFVDGVVEKVKKLYNSN